MVLRAAALRGGTVSEHRPWGRVRQVRDADAACRGSQLVGNWLGERVEHGEVAERAERREVVITAGDVDLAVPGGEQADRDRPQGVVGLVRPIGDGLPVQAPLPRASVRAGAVCSSVRRPVRRCRDRPRSAATASLVPMSACRPRDRRGWSRCPGPPATRAWSNSSNHAHCSVLCVS